MFHRRRCGFLRALRIFFKILFLNIFKNLRDELSLKGILVFFFALFSTIQIGGMVISENNYNWLEQNIKIKRF